MRRGLSEPEVVSIRPTNISRTVGEIKEMQKYENERSAGGGVKASGGYGSTVAGITGGIGARFRKQFLSSKIKESTLPNELLIANASGTANRAIWEFYRGDGIEAIGQYNLEIIFRLQGRPPYKERFCYCVDWNIEVNGRKLWDHKVEQENKRLNVLFNCKRLMDNMNVNDTDKKELMKKESMNQTNGTVSWETIVLDDNQDREKTLKKLKKLIQEDDPDIDKRLLRPLILLSSSEKNPPSRILIASPLRRLQKLRISKPVPH